jgi:hypothetical protein
VAFTIEVDNEADHRIEHWTTLSGKREGVWQTSMAMWWNCLRYVGAEPITVKELTRLARTGTNLDGMRRWGYIWVDAAPPKSVRATPKGLAAREVWKELPGAVEKRWQERFVNGEVERLRDALFTLASQFVLDLPDCLPILHYGLFSPGPESRRELPVERGLPLCVLLARVLLSFSLDFERDSALSLAICANVLRVLDEKGIRQRDLPALSGVSKESIAMAMGILRKKGSPSWKRTLPARRLFA